MMGAIVITDEMARAWQAVAAKKTSWILCDEINRPDGNRSGA
jgi:hypothetical protein